MCGRYFFSLESDELKNYWEIIRGVAEKQDLKIAHDEVFPSQNIITLTGDVDGDVVPNICRWGFKGFQKGQLIINARSESVEEKKTFKTPFQNTRLVIPTSGFFEWDKNKKKYFFTKNTDPMYLCGFSRYQPNNDLNIPEAIIMTTKPNKSIEDVHDRMPLIIRKSEISKWIYDTEFARTYIDEGIMPSLERKLVAK